EVFGDRGWIELVRYAGNAQERFEAGAERDPLARAVQEERLLSKSVADEPQPALDGVVHREGPLPHEPVQRVRSPTLPCEQQDLRVTAGSQPARIDRELATDLPMVVDLAVERHDQAPATAGHGLMR